MEVASSSAKQPEAESSGIGEETFSEVTTGKPCEDKNSTEVLPETQLSKEEALEKAYQLQAKRRQQRIVNESREEAERERNRILQTRAMQEQLVKQEETSRKFAIEEAKREKEAHSKERKRQEELIKQEWQERFGMEYPEATETIEDPLATIEKSGRKLVAYWCNRLVTANKDSNKENLKKCLSTLRIYMNNVITHSTDQKFRKIRKSNEAFQTRVASFYGAIDLLNAVGFKDDGGEFYSIQASPDLFLLGCAVKYINLQLDRI